MAKEDDLITAIAESEELKIFETEINFAKAKI